MGVVINARKIGELIPWGIQHYRRYMKISHEHSSPLVEVNFWEVSSERCFVIHDADEVILIAILFFLTDEMQFVCIGNLLSKWESVENVFLKVLKVWFAGCLVVLAVGGSRQVVVPHGIPLAHVT